MEEKEHGGNIGALIRAVCFCLVFLVLFVFVSYVMRSDHYDRRSLTSFYAEPDNTIDMVYIGGSSCLAYWAPMQAWGEFGFTSYSYGVSSITPQTMKYCLIETQKNQNPQLYVIDLRPFEYGSELDGNGVAFMYREPNIRLVSDAFKYSKNRFDLIENCLPPQTGSLPFHFDISMYHTNLEALSDREHWQYAMFSKKTFRKGFRTAERFVQIERTDYSGLTEKMPLAEAQSRQFEELLDEVEKRELNVLFVVPPYAIEPEHQMKFNTMRDIVTERGHAYINWNDSFDKTGLDINVDYYDPDHVNVFGCEKYTSVFGAYLCEAYGLPDHRESPEYEEWRSEYSIWEEEFTETKAIVSGLIEEAAQEAEVQEVEH